VFRHELEHGEEGLIVRVVEVRHRQADVSKSRLLKFRAKTDCSINATTEQRNLNLTLNYPCTVRVARLGDFSPNGRLFTRGSFSKFIEVDPIVGILYSPVCIHHF
jgi:hypothetical protein